MYDIYTRVWITRQRPHRYGKRWKREITHAMSLGTVPSIDLFCIILITRFLIIIFFLISH